MVMVDVIMIGTTVKVDAVIIGTVEAEMVETQTVSQDL
jgi:hypothetical protein